MKEFKGTPGPWYWVERMGCFDLTSDALSELEEVIDDGSAGGEYSPTITPDSPDAKLIAAAPELLEALQKLLPEYENIIYNEWSMTEDEDTIRAHAAINKALGEEK